MESKHLVFGTLSGVPIYPIVAATTRLPSVLVCVRGLAQLASAVLSIVSKFVRLSFYMIMIRTKTCFFLRLEAQEQSRHVITIVKMGILWSLRPCCTHTKDLTNMISQDPSMGLV